MTSPAAAFARARLDPTRAVLEGFHALKHALRFGAAIELGVTTDRDRALALARRLAPDVVARLAVLLETVAQAEFEELAPKPPDSGVLAIAHRPPDDLAAAMADRAHPLVLLDRPTSLGNLGAVVRVAAAAEAAGVLTTGTADPWHPTAIRGSAGLHFALPVMRIEALGPFDRPLIAVDPAGEPLSTALPAHSILLFGSERQGLAANWLVRAHRRVAIPMRSGVSSLNLATAAAVVLFSMRQHRSS